MSLSGLGLRTAQSTVNGVSPGPENPWFEPSLANEGMLWFPDLLVPDPTGVLPFVVSALMFSNIRLSHSSLGKHSRGSVGLRWLRYFLMAVSLLIGPLCQHLPAALMLYWASSTTSAMAWNKFLEWKYPAPYDFNACKRPLHNLPAPLQPRAIRRADRP